MVRSIDPLAPGEQQHIAIYEQIDTATVTETEFLTEEQTQQQAPGADTSTKAIFDSAFLGRPAVGSSFQTDSSTPSWGANILVASGGGGSSQSSGGSNSGLQGQRDSTEQAAQSTRSAAENQATARRSAARTAMRMASATESHSVTTKTITNATVFFHAAVAARFGLHPTDYEVLSIVDRMGPLRAVVVRGWSDESLIDEAPSNTGNADEPSRDRMIGFGVVIGWVRALRWFPPRHPAAAEAEPQFIPHSPCIKGFLAAVRIDFDRSDRGQVFTRPTGVVGGRVFEC